MIGCDIMGLTVEQFKAFSDAEQLQTIKELNNSGNVETIINILTDVVYEYDGIYEDTFVHEYPELFVFDGTYKVPE